MNQLALKKNEEDVALSEERFKKSFVQHFMLRVHMFFIMAAVLGSGYLVDLILLSKGVDHLLIRYICSICISYLLFFAFVRLWCWFVLPRKSFDTRDFRFNNFDFGSSGGGYSSKELYKGQGGQFGGAGASGSWMTDSTSDAVRASVVYQNTDTDTFVDELIEDSGSVMPKGKDGAVIGIFIVLVVILVGMASYLIWIAPTLLSGAAFHVFLGISLAHKMRHRDNEYWATSVFKRTRIPFLVILIATIVFCSFVKTRCTNTKTLHEVLYSCHGQ